MQTTLQLLKYSVNQISFALNEQFDYSQKQPVQVNPRFTRSIKKIDQNVCDVSLTFLINDSAECPPPFSMKVIVTGTFRLEEWEKNDNIDLIKTNAVAIIYPFLRSLVATITSNANIPSFILPVFNVIAYFEEEEERKENSVI